MRDVEVKNASSSHAAQSIARQTIDTLRCRVINALFAVSIDYAVCLDK